MFTPTSTSSIQQAQIPLSPTRHAQIIQTIQTYISNWSLSLESGGSPQQTTDFLSSYSPSIEWYDHAFRVRRVGHDAVLGLHKAFNHCNRPFQADVKSILPTCSGAVVEQVWRGKCVNDIVRPDGQVAVKASGNEFVCHVCFVMAIDEEGKITRIDEYYNRRWDEGVAEEEYVVMRGASSK